MALRKIPVPLYICLYDPVVGRECRWRLVDYKTGFGLFEYESECSGRTVMLDADEAWRHAC